METDSPMVNEIVIRLVFVARLEVGELPKPGSLPRPVKTVRYQHQSANNSASVSRVVSTRRMVAV